MEALGINPLALVAQIVNFLVILYILNRFLIKPIVGVIEERRKRIEQGLKDAEGARKEREEAVQEHRRELNEARREANEIIGRAQKVADDSAAHLVATAREESQRIVERGRAEVHAEKERAIGEIRAEVADLAIRAAERVVGESLDGKLQRALVDQFLAETVPQGRSGASRGRRRGLKTS